MSEQPRRRSLLVPTVTTIVIVATLLSLGFWQLQRRVDKLALIAALDERLAAPPVWLPPLTRWGELSPANDEFRRVKLLGSIVPGEEARVYASPSPLRKDVTGPGVWVFAPSYLSGRSSDGKVVVNRGFVPDGTSSPVSPYREPILLTGYIRFPETPGWLTPAADPTKRLWFVRDHLAMARTLGWDKDERVAPFYIDLEAPVPPGGIPKPGPLQVRLKNDHLQYAVTWFLLAATVTIAFGLWLRGARRPQPVAPTSL
jgi:surfeit locus 1 family protein